MHILAIIPARGGSKGIHRKNLRLIGNTSLLERAIRSAQNSSSISDVLVSTEDQEIFENALSLGATVPFLRPDHLANDTAHTIPVITHSIESYIHFSKIKPDIIVLLEPTSPFRTHEQVTLAVNRYLQGDCSSVVTVCPLERKPQNIFLKSSDGILNKYIQSPDENFQRRQDMTHLCRLTSSIYVVGCDHFLASRRLIVSPTAYIEVDPLTSINIDDELDLILARTVSEVHGL